MIFFPDSIRKKYSKIPSILLAPLKSATGKPYRGVKRSLHTALKRAAVHDFTII
jgi:hypothetical protein